jgi:hypothetical protein
VNDTTMFGVVVCLSVAAACGLTRVPDPAAAAYGAERLRCVADNDAAPAARECMRGVDSRYAPMRPDGGP